MEEDGDEVEAEQVLSSLDSEKAKASPTASEEEGSNKVCGYTNKCVCVCVINTLYISYINIHIYI